MVTQSDSLKDRVRQLVQEDVTNRSDLGTSRGVTEEAAVVVSTALERGSPFRR